MKTKLIFGLILLGIGFYLQFDTIDNISTFFGSLCVLIAFFIILPLGSRKSVELKQSISHQNDGQNKTVTLSISSTEIEKNINNCKEYNETLINSEFPEAKTGYGSRIPFAMILIAIAMIGFVIYQNYNNNPHLGAIVLDAVFIACYVFMCLNKCPVIVNSPHESAYFENELPILAIQNANNNNPYFDFVYKTNLKHHDGHAFVSEIKAELKLKKKLPNLLCAQVQIAHNYVQDTLYPYAYFVMVYPDRFSDFVSMLNEKTIQYIGDNDSQFVTDIKHDDGNVILIVHLSEQAKTPYHTNKSDCQALSNTILYMLQLADSTVE